MSRRAVRSNLDCAAAGLFGAHDLRRPRADGEALVTAGAFVLEGARDDDVETGSLRLPGRDFGRRLRRCVRRHWRDRGVLGRRNLLGAPVDLTRRDHEHARVWRQRSNRLEQVDRAESVYAPRLAGINPRARRPTSPQPGEQPRRAGIPTASAMACASVTSPSSGRARSPRTASKWLPTKPSAPVTRIGPSTAGDPSSRLLLSR